MRTRALVGTGLALLLVTVGCLAGLAPDDPLNRASQEATPHDPPEPENGSEHAPPSLTFEIETPEDAKPGEATVNWTIRSDEENETRLETARLHWGPQPVPDEDLEGLRPYGNATGTNQPGSTPASYSTPLDLEEEGTVYVRAEARTGTTDETSHRHWSQEASFQVEAPEGAPEPETRPEHHVPEEIRCGEETIPREDALAGSQDPNLDSLTWVVLKTGFRVAVAWETPEPVAGQLEIRIGDRNETVQETTPRTTHLFVLDDLPHGQTLCFVAQNGDEGDRSLVHGVHLGNAMNAYDLHAQHYTLNQLVLANEAPNRAALEAGLHGYGELLWGATDEHISAGSLIVVYNDATHHNSGWASCYMLFTFWTLDDQEPPTCHRIFDVIFTHDHIPYGAGSTYIDGIQRPDQAIWMNSIWEASQHGGILYSGEQESHEVAFTLTHEIGHYALGAMDLYTSLGQGPDCWDPELEISIMGANRNATEFDDQIHRCPNEDAIDGYVPTWTLMTERYTEIPNRTEGPQDEQGQSPRFELHTFDAIQAVSPAAPEQPKPPS